MGGGALMGAGTAMAAAAVGGFVGSVGSQLVGKAMGVVDSFSLKTALASGATAGVTAGAGAALQSAGTVFGQTVMQGDKLNALGRGIQATATAAGSVAANKLVGNQASFSWRDVATSAVSAYAGTRLFGDNPALAGVTSGDIVRDTFGGIAHAAIGYGAGKLIQKSGDRPSWNFSNVATDAFGNALGNSFVANRRAAEQGKLNKARDENTVAQLIKKGATPQQAAAMVAQQYYNRDTTNSTHEPLANTNVDWADAFSNDEITLSDGTENYKFFTGGVSTAEHANNLLSLVRSTLGDNEFTNFSLGYADKALTSKVNSIATLRSAEERGYFNSHQAYTLRKASFTGFDGNMTDADRWGAITTQTQRWGQEDTSKILAGMAAVTFAPMMAADLLAVGAFAARGGMALGRFSLEGVNNVGRMMYSQYQAHGARGMLLNAGHATSWTSVQVANRAALSSLQQGAGYVARNPLATLEAGYMASSRVVGNALVNPHVQAGLINGTTNTAADIIFNGYVNGKPEDINIAASFLSGVAGGYVGSRLAAFSPRSIQPMMGGMYGSALTEGFDQTIKWITEDKNFNSTDIVIAAAAGSIAGKFIGAGLANYRQTMKAIVPASVTISTIFDETAADFIGNYFNNAVSTWWGQ